jgi:hypothetical protein
MVKKLIKGIGSGNMSVIEKCGGEVYFREYISEKIRISVSQLVRCVPQVGLANKLDRT